MEWTVVALVVFGGGKVLLDRWRARKRRAVVAAAFKHDRDTWEARLVAEDPHFDLRALVEKIEGIVLRIHQAATAGDLAPVRSFMLPSALPQLCSQIRRVHSRYPETITAQQLALEAVEVARDGAVDSIAFEIRDNLGEAKCEHGWRTGVIWRFCRKVGAQTSAGRDLLHDRCPACGCAMAIRVANVCEACHAVVGSGDHDWTLAAVMESYIRESYLEVSPMIKEGGKEAVTPVMSSA